MKSNFEFLNRYWPALAQIGAAAESYVYSDANACLYKLGMFGERLILEIFAFEHIKEPTIDNTHANRIRLLKREGLIPKKIDDILYALRKTRNDAVHAGADSVEDAKTLLSMTYNLAVWFMEVYVKSICDAKATGTAQKTVGLATLRELLIPVAPYKEQMQIYAQTQDALSIVDSVSSDKEDLLNIIESAKAKILDLAIRGQLVPQDPTDEPASVLLERIRAEKEELIKQGKIKRDKKESVIFRGEDNSYYEKMGGKVVNIDDEIPFELPESWAWCRGYSCFEGLGSTKPQGDFFDYIDIDAIDNRLHCIKDAKHLPVSDAPSRASRAVKDGSVLFSLVRPYLENIALVEEKHSNCIASTGFYVCNSNGVLLPEFMFFLMISGYVVNGLNQYMKGDNSPSISKDNIENWLYPVPPIGEQQTICAKLKTVFTLVENVEKSLN